MAKKPTKKEEQPTPTPAEALNALQNIATQLNSIVPQQQPQQEQTTMTAPTQVITPTSAPEQQANTPTPTVVPAQPATPTPEQQTASTPAATAPAPAPTLTLESVNSRVDSLEQRVKNVEDTTSNILDILASKECLEEISTPPAPIVISGGSSGSSVPGWVYPTAAVCGVAAIGIAAYHVFKD